MSDYFDPNNEELLNDFFIEATQQIELLEQNILAIESNPGDKEAIDEIFRAAHTLKGSSATVQMEELTGFTHIVEDLLDEIRSDKVVITEGVVDVLLNSIDTIKSMISERQDGSVFDEDISGLKDRLKAFLGGGTPAAVTTPEASATKDEPELNDVSTSVSEYEMLELKEAAGDGKVYQVSVSFDESNPMNSVGGIQVFARLKDKGSILKTIPDFEKLYEDQYWAVVEYFVATENSEEDLKVAATISDVTTNVTVSDLDGEDIKVFEKEEVTVSVPASTPVEKKASVSKEVVESTEEKSIENIQEEIEEAQAEAAVQKKPVPKKKSKAASSSILRVDSKRIDNLLNLVSEAVINKASFNQISNQFVDITTELSVAENEYKERLKTLFENIPQILEKVQKGESPAELRDDLSNQYEDLFAVFDSFDSKLKTTLGVFKNTAANLGRNTGDLHEGILRIRMVPINQIFSRFPRLVRDLCKSLDKKVDLVIEGEDTELDKSVTEQLLDPLMHCIRNSLDHGIEHPEERTEAGKDEMGTLFLKASNEGNMIVIEVSDDGAGINPERIRTKAIERGVIHPGKSLTDADVYNLIFEPGFSTAKTVTNVSGRGVGLDVVKKEIEKLNGSVSVDSELGKGTKFTIKLPLTLAIVQGLLVRVGTEIYAIPITSVIESHRIKPDDIKIIDNYEVFNVRSDVISLLRLDKLFRIPSESDKEHLFVVIVGSGDKKMGLVVDSLIGEEDVVIKPLKDRYTNSPGIAGATILGDGTVSLIIDVSQLLDLGVKRAQENRQQNALTFR
ncbi:MAG: chemotaxis protein CheA [Spirochaetales bacterium]|nr:chemotaxis protein CheA [Spirochaetales bacterium]